MLIAAQWSLLKVAIGHALDVSPDALHVVIGTALFVGVRRALPQRLGWAPWLALLAIECGNELLDLLRPPGGPENGLLASLHDLVLTMLLPSLLIWASRGSRPALQHTGGDIGPQPGFARLPSPRTVNRAPNCPPMEEV